MTTIKITPPGGEQIEIKKFQACRTSQSITDKAGSFNLILPEFNSSLVDTFPVGSDVQIEQNGNKFRGWVNRPLKSLNKNLRTVELSGVSYTARTQKVIVTENYIGANIHHIVLDLFEKYMTPAKLGYIITANHVQPTAKIINIKFNDIFLWDAMNQLAEIAHYDWYIDEHLDLHFFRRGERVNPTTLSQTAGNYKRGTANLSKDSSKLVNRLIVKGGYATPPPYTQQVSISPSYPYIDLNYVPILSEGMTIMINGEEKTWAISEHIFPGQQALYDFTIQVGGSRLYNYGATLSGTGTVTYSHKNLYPIKILLEDLESQQKYGLFEDILKVDVDDKTLAREMGIEHLTKYCEPVWSGSIQPMDGQYSAGELIKVEIHDLNINDYLLIKQVDYESVPGQGRVNVTLQLESPTRNATEILRDLELRLRRIESRVFNDDDAPLERSNAFTEILFLPKMSETFIFHKEHANHICSENLACSVNLRI